MDQLDVLAVQEDQVVLEDLVAPDPLETQDLLGNQEALVSPEE